MSFSSDRMPLSSVSISQLNEKSHCVNFTLYSLSGTGEALCMGLNFIIAAELLLHLF